ncbi:DUF3120 domain-containing protein [Oscillatoria sp. CS-180]|uniref:DUF3120 domain-containing protein n=1 Tax=Oscillatoria sp. CS-180 TaxID=3021720 RepID=UPI00233127DF|nr:DUF3120 domain-containing protein [Oscillatoria sp. CS-180]MDB9527347.1 DUF3120 domain-containing protein [Oscillatoria sp. CS-180]
MTNRFQKDPHFSFATKHIEIAAEALLLNPRHPWIGVSLGILLVSVPVFFEAPLVRVAPGFSVALTGGWVWLSYHLSQKKQTEFIGDLLLGFSLSWLAGAVYWGWFRWEPLWHLPIESLGLPVALWGLYQGWARVGHCFYLGSLLGTAATDLYFYWMELMPYWRRLMAAPPDQAFDIIRMGFAEVQTMEGAIAAATFGLLLLWLAWMSWRSARREDWIFSGTLLGTLLVDSLFVALAQF